MLLPDSCLQLDAAERWFPRVNGGGGDSMIVMRRLDARDPRRRGHCSSAARPVGESLSWGAWLVVGGGGGSLK